MKILYLCTYYHQAMIFRDSMDRLHDRGHEVKAFNAALKGSPVQEKYKPIMDERVTHKELFTKWDRYFYHYKQDKFYRALVKAETVDAYDIIHAHTLFNGGYVAYRLHKERGIPYVVSIRNTDLNTFLKFPFFKSIANRIINKASGVLFLSEPYKNSFIDRYVHSGQIESVRKKTVVIRNGLEPFWIDNRFRPKTLEDPRRITLLCVGTIDRNKNILTVLSAAELLRREGLSVEVRIIGQVISESVYHEIKQARNTTVIDFLPKEELIAHYRAADIYIMPSIHETFGRVYAEAMTQGLPVLYSKGQGFDGIYPDGVVGYSVPSMDAQYIAAKIKDIIANYGEISQNAIRHSTDFRWEQIAEELETFYQRALH